MNKVNPVFYGEKYCILIVIRSLFLWQLPSQVIKFNSKLLWLKCGNKIPEQINSSY